MDADAICLMQRTLNEHDVVVMGIMGAGKTTLVNHLQRLAPLRYIAQGDITRSIVEYDNNPRVLEAARHAKPWPFDLVLEILDPYLQIDQPFVLDGLPKHDHEAQWLARLFRQRGNPVSVVLLEADRETVLSRLRSDGRSHRNESAEEIDHRMSTFEQNFQSNLAILQPVTSQVIRLKSDRPPLALIAQLADRLRDGQGP